ncbi:carbon-nitrogen family hydrolase [bacterium]|nr:carbon-nitrogen family hydrolase [bacterium]
MKLALYQMSIRTGDPDENAAAAEWAVRTAAGDGDDLIVLPEFWATGFALAKLPDLAAPMGEGMFELMRTWAVRYGIAVAGTHPRISGSRLFNTAVFYDRTGALLASYDKMHLFASMQEDRLLTRGSSPPAVFSAEWGRIGMITCFDLRFPELARRLALDGAQLIVVPAFWPAPRLDHWSLLLRARAVENQVFIAGCNRADGSEPAAFGRSAVIAPDGTVAAEAGTAPILLKSAIEPGKTATIRQNFPVMTARLPGEYGNF